jgi:hypothetical protein
MPQRRRMVVCLNCREHKEHAAHGLCSACRKRTEREQAEPLIDPHGQGGLSRRHLRLLAGFHRVMDGCGKLKVSERDLMKIRGLLNTYLEPVQEFLSPALPQYVHPGGPDGGHAGGHHVDDEPADGDERGTEVEPSVTDSPLAGAR